MATAWSRRPARPRASARPPIRSWFAFLGISSASIVFGMKSSPRCTPFTGRAGDAIQLAAPLLSELTLAHAPAQVAGLGGVGRLYATHHRSSTSRDSSSRDICTSWSAITIESPTYGRLPLYASVFVHTRCRTGRLMSDLPLCGGGHLPRTLVESAVPDFQVISDPQQGVGLTRVTAGGSLIRGCH
jgi:hypothetical protein